VTGVVVSGDVLVSGVVVPGVVEVSGVVGVFGLVVPVTGWVVPGCWLRSSGSLVGRCCVPSGWV